MEGASSIEEGRALLASVLEFMAQLRSGAIEVPDHELGPLFAQMHVLDERARVAQLAIGHEAQQRGVALAPERPAGAGWPPPSP